MKLISLIFKDFFEYVIFFSYVKKGSCITTCSIRKVRYYVFTEYVVQTLLYCAYNIVLLLEKYL